MGGPLPVPERRVLRPDEAAQYLGYDRATPAFYAYCAALEIQPIRRGAYDRIAIDRALDRASGLISRDDYEAVQW